MNRAVLADTGPLYAAVDPDDQYHARAQAELNDLAEGEKARTVYLTGGAQEAIGVWVRGE